MYFTFKLVETEYSETELADTVAYTVFEANNTSDIFKLNSELGIA